MSDAAKRLLMEALGWVVLVAGIAALFLPGPGLLLTFAGLALLSRQYAWAERWVEPVRLRALRGAAESVETWPRVVFSTLGALAIGGFGVLWIVEPPAPSWWPLEASMWLLGGDWTGVTMLASSLIALALVAYSYRRFHGRPDAVSALEGEIDEADEDWQEHHPRLHRRDEEE
ncbi:PGPGW domain-containing protein [Nocardioides sp. YIM 152588]|uniref:PGPGW domain-containing protein n=1 Tax=Nocardioides sp. YIM 152588 TaxID=3158259 RepID=UPI0032E3CDD1